MKEDFTKDNIYKKIEESSLSAAEKIQYKQNVDSYYAKKLPDYAKDSADDEENDGLAYGKIAPMFGETGGGYQYDMPLNMNQLISIGMIEEIYNY